MACMRALWASGVLGAWLLVGASSPTRDPILGPWQFKTPVYAETCTLSGSMMIAAGKRPNAYVCRFTAVETCQDWKVTSEQTCTATRQGDTLAISSAIVSLRPKQPDGWYWPDNFVLRVESAQRMSGKLDSATIAPATFWRASPAIS